ncbi:MAG: MinD/ParA family protein [Lachnospiraceae bacterium]|nr:MinD/ParA family protein [Lachnospiraceae bacterium]
MDQAQGLRNVVKAQNVINTKEARIITITSGKGGVGKSNCAVNLALQFRKMGKRVIILDADFGLANVEVLCGTVPKYNLSDYIFGESELEEIITAGPEGIGFISGGSGIVKLNNLNSDQLNGVIYGLSKLNQLCDVLLIDTGAGVSETVMSFVLSSPEVIVVTTPEPSSITDAYSLIKAVYKSDGARRGTLPTLFILANRIVASDEGAAVYEKLNSVVGKFLGGSLSYLGDIPSDALLETAVRNQQIVSLVSPAAKSSRAFYEVANRLLGNDSGGQKSLGLFGFFNSFIKKQGDIR